MLIKYVTKEHIVAHKSGSTYRSARVDSFPHYETIPANECIAVVADKLDTPVHAEAVSLIWNHSQYTLGCEQFSRLRLLVEQ
jgi:hypothetical protein